MLTLLTIIVLHVGLHRLEPQDTTERFNDSLLCKYQYTTMHLYHQRIIFYLAVGTETISSEFTIKSILLVIIKFLSKRSVRCYMSRPQLSEPSRPMAMSYHPC